MKAITQAIAKASDALSTLAFAGFLIAILAQVAYRYLGVTMVWSEEMARLLNVYMVFFGLIVVTFRADHLKIDILERTISSPSILKTLRIVHLALAFIFLLVLTYGAYLLTISSWGQRLSTMAWANHGMFYLAPLIGCSVSSLLVALQLIGSFFVPTLDEGAR